LNRQDTFSPTAKYQLLKPVEKLLVMEIMFYFFMRNTELASKNRQTGNDSRRPMAGGVDTYEEAKHAACTFEVFP